MPSASSLSLGQSGFALVADSDGLGTPNVQGPFNGGSSTSFLVNNAVVGSPIENLTLNTDLSPPTSSTNVSFGSAVSGLDANLGDGADTIAFNSAVVDSTIFTDLTPTSGAGGGDRFVANGGVFGTTINTGAGNDTLLFSKELFDSTIATGAGNDQVTVNPGSFVSNSSFSLGDGNDVLTFQGVVFGFGETSSISLGTGADTLIFGSNSYVAGYSIDLGGADAAIDSVTFSSGIDESNALQITGASAGDVLLIGAGSFAGTWAFEDGTGFTDGSDTLTWLT